MSKGLASLSIKELVHEEVGLRVTGAAEPLGIGPTVMTMQGGLMAANGLALACPELIAKLSVSAGRQNGTHFVQLQLDIVHGVAIAASFAFGLDDFDRLLERLRAPLELARFEQHHAGGVGNDEPRTSAGDSASRRDPDAGGAPLRPDGG